MPDWVLAIDYGTTTTAAAMAWEDRVELVEIGGAPRVPSAVFLREEETRPPTLVVGEEAENRAGQAPWCLERTPKRRLGDETMLLGETEVPVVDAVRAVLRVVADEAIRRRGGEEPVEVVLTYPARWGRDRRAALQQAAVAEGLGPLTLVPEPVAAAAHFAGARLEVGDHVAVYDLGGGTFDTAVLCRTADGFEVVGEPGGREDLGGEDFDDALYRHLGEQLDEETWATLRSSRERTWAEANRELRRQARRAKEGLSSSPDYPVWAPAPVARDLLVTEGELHALVAADLEGTLTELEDTIQRAGVPRDRLAAVYLAGGSSRIPLVGRLVEQRLGVVPMYLDDPKSVVALGAARLAVARRRRRAASEAPRSVASLRVGQPLAAACGLALLLSLFLPWYGAPRASSVEGSYLVEHPGHGVSAWGALGLADLVLALAGLAVAAIAALAVRRPDVRLPVPAGPVTAALGGLATLLALARVIDPPGALSLRPGALIGLAAAAGIAYGGWRMLESEGARASEIVARARAAAGI